jgi:hypothetical protein
MHVIVMGADGQTRRLSFSIRTLWMLLFSLLAALAALAFAVHLYVGALLESRRLATELESATRLSQLREYSKTVDMAPEEARRILELLDRAILMADNSEIDDALVGVPDDSPDGDGGQDSASEEGQGDPPPVPEGDPLEALWSRFHSSLASLPTANPPILDTEEFQIALDGEVSFVLKQNAGAGQRARGRTVIFLAVADADGNLSLMTTPEIDLADPDASGWELGSKYNIIASKVVRGKIEIPEGGQVLNAEVLAWDEDSKELVFRKKIKIEGR